MFTSRCPLRLLPILLLLCAVPLGPAQPPDKDKPKPGDEMINKYLAAETDKLSKKTFDGATTLAEWKERRPRLYQEYLYMLGLSPLPEKTPLQAKVTGKLERDNFIVEKLHFQSKPGLYVTANLYRPKTIKGKLPAVLYVCGHSWKGRDGNKSAHQDHGMWFATNGYVCIILDTLQLGEIPGVHHGTYGTPYRHFRTYGIKDRPEVENRFWWYCAGYTPAGVECWNGIRAIDYLCSRPDVDPERIGVTGISGGGAATFWIAAADERVKVAVPVSGMSDLESYVKHKVINGHCDCMFLYNTYQWEWTTIAALVAPRPLLFANSDNDRIFPMDGNRRIIDRLRKLYKLYGKPELVDEYVSKGDHAYRPDLRIAVFKFLNKHLKNDTKTPVTDSAEFKPFAGKELRVFPEDKDIPKDQINTKIDETFVPRAQVELPEAEKFAEWKKDLLARLQSQCFRAIPLKISPAKVVRWGFGHGPAGSLETDPGIQVVSLLVVPDKKKELNLFVDLDPVLDEKGFRKKLASVFGMKEWDPSLESINLMVLWPRGIYRGIYLDAWSQKSPPNYVERSHALLGQTLDDGRIRDILAAIAWTKNKGIKEYKVVGQGRGGILAAYAALFEPSIKEVVIIDPPTSHMQGPYFLNVLRVLDIPEALGLLAPNVKLTLVNAKDKAFDRTAQIYKLAGAEKKFERK
jgi:cephalosporin-C deacetylase-like acetyl esterase